MKTALCLYGYFDSLTDKTSKGEDGYIHLKKNVLDKSDVDVFVHSWQPEKESRITELYKPVKSMFKEQYDFNITTKKFGITLKDLGFENKLGNAHSGLNESGGSGLVGPERILSHFYSKCVSIKLAIEYALFNEFEYDWVIVARFDTGRINRNTSKPGSGNPWPVQCIKFDENYEDDYFYTAYWNLFNEGPADMWFYSNQYNMRIFSELYNYTLSYLQPNSDYSKAVTDGWPESSINNFRTNEIFKKEKTFNLHKYQPHERINAILLQKWFFIHTGLWDKLKAIKTEWK